MTLNNVCNICESVSSKIFDAMILGKYRADYFQCKNCSFIQTEKPFWLPEAYKSAITALDVGLIYRNVRLSKIIPNILNMFSRKDDSYIDYGGGYGIFVRMMRDLGFDYYLTDLYAENLYAKHFELNDFKGKTKFACLTAFEVFEHLENPITEISKMFDLSSTIIFSTEIQPAESFKSFSDWSYFLPEIGQHISFFSTNSLKFLSQKYDCKLYSNNYDLHILTKSPLEFDPFENKEPVKASLLRRAVNRLFKRNNLKLNLLIDLLY